MGVRSSQPKSPNLNKTDGHLLEYLRNTFVAGGGALNPVPAQGMTATGGIVNDYSDPGSGKIYRSHIFTSSGSFSVSAYGAGSPTAQAVEYLVVGAGGGGGGGTGGAGGGGGAGAFRTGTLPISTSPGSYTVTIGAGGAGGYGNPSSDPANGS